MCNKLPQCLTLYMYVCMETLLSYTCISLPENRHKPDGVYSLSENVQRRGDVKRFYRQNYRGIQTEIAVQWRDTFTDGIADGITDGIADGITDGSNPSVIPSEKTIICPPICRHSLPLFLLLLLSHPTSPLPNCTSPPKLQPNTHPYSPLFSTRALKFLISCTWSQYPFLVDFIIFL